MKPDSNTRLPKLQNYILMLNMVHLEGAWIWRGPCRMVTLYRKATVHISHLHPIYICTCQLTSASVPSTHILLSFFVCLFWGHSQ